MSEHLELWFNIRIQNTAVVLKLKYIPPDA